MAVDLKLPGAKTAEPTSEESAGDATAMQEGIVQRYCVASGYILAAQVELAKAFELKDQAAQLEAEAATLQGGATLDKDAIKKNRQISDDASAAIQAKLDAEAPLTDEGRQHYINSLAPFANGVAETSKLPAEASAFSNAAQTTIKSASMTEKLSVTSKLAAGTYLAKEIPGYSARTMDTFKKIVTYANKNNIPVPEDATSLLGM
jgi:hypothetical protein